MPWKETCVMDERLKFIGKYLRNESSMVSLCQEFNISRKTGYNLIQRYLLEGPVGLYDRSRAPHSHPYAVSEDIITQILRLREEHPDWGPRKLLEWLKRHRPRTQWPCASTIGRILSRNGKIVPHKRRSKTPPYTQPFISSTKPNMIWCADFKGWFSTGDGKRCEPLTVTDSYRAAMYWRAGLCRGAHMPMSGQYSNLFFGSTAYLGLSVPTMELRLHPVLWAVCHACLFGGSSWAYCRNGSSLAIRNKTEGTNAFIAPSRKGQYLRPGIHLLINRRLLINSAGSTIRNVRMRPWTIKHHLIVIINLKDHYLQNRLK
jgi:transposase